MTRWACRATFALEVLLPIFVTMLLGYGAAWHHHFDEKQVPVLNKMVLLYAVPMSVSVGILKTSRAFAAVAAGQTASRYSGVYS